MAAWLLMSPQPLVHSRTDDLESFLHVLSWVALSFMPHGLNANTLTKYLNDVFEDAWEDEDGSARGGGHKKSAILEGRILKSRFTNPKIQTLLEDLTTTFAVRYQNSPSEEELAEYHESQQSQNLGSRLLQAMASKSYAGQFLRKQDALENSDWMLETLTTALEERTAWPESDKSQANRLVSQPNPERKRKSEVELFPRQRRRCSAR